MAGNTLCFEARIIPAVECDAEVKPATTAEAKITPALEGVVEVSEC